MNKLLLDEDVKNVLTWARKIYGNKNQILVSMEELNELACVLAKYPRYDDSDKATSELHDKVVDEVADVIVVLNHIMNIFSLSDEEVDSRIVKKVGRLKRWIDHSSSMQETVDDRKIEEPTSKCKSCQHSKEDPDTRHNGACHVCQQALATEGVVPFYIIF